MEVQNNFKINRSIGFQLSHTLYSKHEPKSGLLHRYCSVACKCSLCLSYISDKLVPNFQLTILGDLIPHHNCIFTFKPFMSIGPQVNKCVLLSFCPGVVLFLLHCGVKNTPFLILHLEEARAPSPVAWCGWAVGQALVSSQDSTGSWQRLWIIWNLLHIHGKPAAE